MKFYLIIFYLLAFYIQHVSPGQEMHDIYTCTRGQARQNHNREKWLLFLDTIGRSDCCPEHLSRDLRATLRSKRYFLIAQ
jgi:hypothetical protein